MPIKDWTPYGLDWPTVSLAAKEAAGWKCQCDGRCGWRNCGVRLHRTRCGAEHDAPHPVTGKPVVLTTAHLDHTPENRDTENLMVMCQGCHLVYDKEQHAETRAANRAQ